MSSQVKRLREVRLPEGVPGRLFLSEMPGRDGPLEAYEEEVRAVGVGRILCLAEDKELPAAYYEKVRAGELGGARILRFPIPDFGVPEDPEGLVDVARDLAQALREGEHVLIHCFGGKGRTGTVAICVLLALGPPLGEAEERVDEAGSGPERKEQQELIQKLASKLPPSA